MKKKVIALALEVEGTVEDEGYKACVFTGVKAASIKHNCNLICFAGGAWKRSPYNLNEPFLNVLYDLISPEYLDGIILGFTVVCYSTEKERLELFHKLSPLPIVSVGPVADDISSVRINNYAGMKDAIDHLIDVHKCMSIAFIKGPVGNREGDERFAAYLDSLEEHGILIDETIIFNGNFLPDAGKYAASNVLAKNGPKVDAIVAANDHMALGAATEIVCMGYNVPQDIKIIGFDDSEKAKLAMPGLTTVQVPLDIISERAVLKLLEKIDDPSKGPEHEYTPSKVIIRSSCGCINPFGSVLADSVPLSAEQIKFVEFLNAGKGSLFSDLPGPGQMQKLKDSIEKFISSEEEDWSDVLFFFSSAIMKKRPDEKSYNHLQEFITCIHGYFQKTVSSKMKNRLLSLISQFRVIAAEAVYVNFRRNSSIHRFLSEALQNLNRGLYFQIGRNDIFESLEEALAHLNVSHCFIILYKREFLQAGDVTNLNQAHIIFSYIEKKRISSFESGEVFQTVKLLPKELWKELKDFRFLAEPLYMADLQLGYMLISMDFEEGMPYETLRSQISSAIYTDILFKRQQKSENSLREALSNLENMNKKLAAISTTDELTGLNNRRGFIQQAEQLLTLARRSSANFLIFYMDMDGLKYINDNFGHGEGDKVIRQFADILRKCFRKADLIGRLGGDEFVVLAYNTNGKFLQNIRKRLESYFNAENNKPDSKYKIGASIGIEEFHSDDFSGEISLDQLLSAADRKQYLEKKAKKRMRGTPVE